MTQRPSELDRAHHTPLMRGIAASRGLPSADADAIIRAYESGAITAAVGHKLISSHYPGKALPAAVAACRPGGREALSPRDTAKMSAPETAEQIAAQIVISYTGACRAQSCQTVQLPITSIQPVHGTDAGKVARFAAMGAANVPPISVRRQGAGFVMLDGHHRLAAARSRGDKTIPAVIGTVQPTKTGSRFVAERPMDRSTEAGAAAAEILDLYRSV